MSLNQDSHNGDNAAVADMMPAQKRIRFKAILVTGSTGAYTPELLHPTLLVCQDADCCLSSHSMMDCSVCAPCLGNHHLHCNLFCLQQFKPYGHTPTVPSYRFSGNDTVCACCADNRPCTCTCPETRNHHIVGSQCLLQLPDCWQNERAYSYISAVLQDRHS